MAVEVSAAVGPTAGPSAGRWVQVPGHQTLASSISRKSLCMGTLPCSFTL